MSSTVTFDGAPPPGTINLGVGQPSADLLPVELMRKASEAFYRKATPIELNYGVTAGDERFLHSLAGYLSTGYRAPVNAESLFVTGGNSQALDLVSSIFAKPCDTVFVEEPSYFLAFQIFRDRGLNIVGIPIDDQGIRIDCLEEELRKHKPAFLYTVPSYHNPGGQCLSEERRRRILELSRQHDFLIVADEVYQLLSYYESPPPAFGTYCNSGPVLSLGSFSKILAPGLRLGWIQTSENLRQLLLSNGFINSGGSINHYTSHIVRHAIDDGLLTAHVSLLKNAYRSRVEAMETALLEHFGDIAQWNRPDGGYFFWLSLARSTDTAAIKELANEHQTGFQPGAVFSSCGELNSFLRLSFAHYSEEEITEGVARLRPLFG